VGALLAIGVVFLVEYLDDTVKNPDDIREQTGLTTLAAVITIKGSTPQERLATAMGSKSPASEAYRVLRTNLQFSSLDKPLRSLLVTSPSPGEGKTTTAANLAIVMAQTGQQVVLLDCDLRRPSIHRMFQLPNNTGLTTALLQSNTAAAEFLRDTNVSNLKVMTTGPVPPNPAELLGSGRMLELLDQLQDKANMVIIDSPPVLAVADSAILSTHSDGTILVVSAGETRFDVLIRAVERLHGVGVRPLGVILNKLSERGSGYYYYYDYRYASTYAEDGSDDGDNKGGRWRRGGRPRRSPAGKVGEQVS
jgi:non-specific protein-tyrosine kinase